MTVAVALAPESPTTKSKDGNMTMKAPTPTKPDLATVEVARADKINAEHAACEGALNKTFEHAHRAGELLSEVKSQLPHGDWYPWLDKHFNGSHRTAQVYMRVAAELPNAKRSAHLSIDRALKQLAAPKTDDERFFAECAALEAQIERATLAEKKLASLLRDHASDDATLEKIAERGRLTKARLKRLRDKKEAAA